MGADRFANFFGIEIRVGGFVSMITAFEFRQWTRSVNRRIVGMIVLVNHQATIKYQ